MPASAVQASAPIFLVLRRMRTPLITLILIFAISVLGLSLIPGLDGAGRPARLSIFHSFYVMSYTATTIGFGELPDPFTDAQRLWVTGTIFITVIGWAYAISALLSLLQDRAFRPRWRCSTSAARWPGCASRSCSSPATGRPASCSAAPSTSSAAGSPSSTPATPGSTPWSWTPCGADVPGLVGDARNPHDLQVAGLEPPLLRGGARAHRRRRGQPRRRHVRRAAAPGADRRGPHHLAVVAERMGAFGSPTVINPFDRFGDHLRLALHSPAAYRLMNWLESGPGAALPERADAPPPAAGWSAATAGSAGTSPPTCAARGWR